MSEESLRKEIFFLAYHLHWSWEGIVGLESAERRAYVRLLIEQIERENAQVREAQQV